ncbi:MAG: kelch repeat-containing protein [Sandaracinaceae bacterium]
MPITSSRSVGARARRSVLLAIFATMLACGTPASGTDAGTAVGDGAVGRDDGGVGRDGSVPRPPPAMCGGDVLRIAHAYQALGRIVTGRLNHGLIQEGTHRLVSFPEHLSESLARMEYLELTDEGGVMRSAAVAGTPPAGQIFQAIYHPGLGRYVLLVLERDPLRYLLYTMTLDAGVATFEALTSTGTPSGEGTAMTAMAPLGADRLFVERAQDYFLVDVAGERATWSEPTFFMDAFRPSVRVTDAAGERMLGFGEYRYDAATGDFPLVSAVLARTLPDGEWTEIPTSGEGPPTVLESGGGPQSFLAYDRAADRLLVVVSREVYDEIFMMTYLQDALYALDLRTGAWELVVDAFRDQLFSYGGAWAVDDVHHRALAISYDQLHTLSTDGDTLGAAESLMLEGAIGPSSIDAGVSLADGRVLALEGNHLLVFDPAASEPRWDPFGPLDLPFDVGYGSSLERDPSTGDVWLYGGASNNAAPSMGRVLRIAADASGFEEVATTGAPPPRAAHAALIAGREMFVVGGAAGFDGELDDVWALHLDTGAWRRVATLPSPRARSALRMVDDELWVIGGVAGADGVDEVIAIDPASGAVREVSVSGAWPARGGILYGAVAIASGLAAFDLIDDTLDSSATELFFLRPSGAGAAWESLGECFVDWNVADLRGVELDEDHAFMAGAAVFDLRATR